MRPFAFFLAEPKKDTTMNDTLTQTPKQLKERRAQEAFFRELNDLGYENIDKMMYVIFTVTWSRLENNDQPGDIIELFPIWNACWKYKEVLESDFKT